MRSRLLVTVAALAAACSSDRRGAPAGAAGGDAGVDRDAATDAGPPGDDADVSRGTDGGTDARQAEDASDARPADGGEPDGGVAACSFEEPGSADGDRVVLLGHPFGATAGVQGTEVRSLTLTAAGELVDDGARLDVGTRPDRIALLPSGELALVLGEDGSLVALRLSGAADLEAGDRLDLPSAGYGALALADGGRTVFVAGSNSTDTGGISTVEVACDGTLTLRGDLFFPLRLTDTLALLPGGRRALVRGGQALFEPEDHDDLRLLERSEAGWRQVAAADVFIDYVSTAGLGLAPDGTWALVPNHSIFSDEGSQVALIDVGQDALGERRRLVDLPDPQEVLFAPDGGTVLLTLAEPGQVVVFVPTEAGVEEVARVRGIGLADQMALVDRGPLSGRVLLPSVDPAGGPNVAVLQIAGPGEVRDLGQLELGGGAVQIPTAIGLQP